MGSYQEENWRYFKNFTINLAGGRVINLVAFTQRLTYAGLLEGLPFYNSGQVEKDRENARKQFGCPSVTIDASPVPIPLSPEEREAEARRVKSLLAARKSLGEDADLPGFPENDELTSLPPVTTIAQFESYSPARDDEAHGSHLVMVWYQGSFGLPVDQAILAKIQQVDWDGQARDFQF